MVQKAKALITAAFGTGCPGFPASMGMPWPPSFKCAYFFYVCLHTGFTSRL